MLKALQNIFGVVRVKDIMHSPVLTIGRDENLSAAALKFSTYHVSHLVVVGSDGKVIGIISPKYLYKTQSPRRVLNEQLLYHPGVIVDGQTFYESETLDAYRIKDVMKSYPQTLRRAQTVVDAVRMMSRFNLSCIPVVDRNHRPVGVITEREIIDYAASVLV